VNVQVDDGVKHPPHDNGGAACKQQSLSIRPPLRGAVAFDRTVEPQAKPEAGGVRTMAVIAMFYGIIVSMYYFDKRRHHLPHIHVKYQDQEAVIAIPGGEILEGELKASRLKLVQAWIEIHQDELMADWELASQGQNVFRIEPLK